MTITIPYRGVIEIVGEHDVGKTLAALQVVNLNEPQPFLKTVFVDDDEKGDGTVRQLASSNVQFEKYINVGEWKAKAGTGVLTPDDMLDKVIFPIVEEICKGQHELIVWDTWRSVYQTARGHVERNQNKYRDVVTFRGTSMMIQGLISKVAREIEKGIIERLKAHCEVLVMTHHLKDRYENNVRVEGSYVPESSKTISEVCNMRIWLRRNPASKVPIMLFLKRPNLPKVTPQGIKFVNIVPMKVVPKPQDETIWDAMKRYESDPIESRQPTNEETPTAEEYALISGTLTEGQKMYVREMAKYQAENQEAVEDLVQSLVPQKVGDGIDSDLEKDFPAEVSPKNIGELYKTAEDKYDLSQADIQELTGKGFQDVLAMGEQEIGELWTSITKIVEQALQ